MYFTLVNSKKQQQFLELLAALASAVPNQYGTPHVTGQGPNYDLCLCTILFMLIKFLTINRFHEAGVLFLFILLVLLFFFRDPKFMPGWASLIPFDK